MKTLIISGILIIGGCNAIQDKSSVKRITKPAVQIFGDSSESPFMHNDSNLSVWQYGEKIIRGELKPSDDIKTFALLDSLQSDNPETRYFAFRVYKVMVVSSDGFLSEAIAGHIKTYFSSNPKEFLEHYKILDNNEKSATLESVAFEFYASGLDYKEDLNEYFDSILSQCAECTASDKIILQEIRSSLEIQIGKMVE